MKNLVVLNIQIQKVQREQEQETLFVEATS